MDAVGPTADLILNDVFSIMDISPDRVPINQAADVVLKASDAIADIELKAAFQMSMVKKIPKQLKTNLKRR